MKISAFLPCRQGSQRVPRKNIKPFANFDFGLIEIKLTQLLSVDSISEVVLSTNDREILDFAQTINHPKLRIVVRSDDLCSSSTSTDDLVQHAVDLIPDGHILWTHVTSPLITSEIYSKAIKLYKAALNNGYDSLMSTCLIHAFLWNEEEPINYDRNVEKWPRTQTLQPLHEVNSAIFLNSSENYKNINDRIGAKPYMFVMDKITGFDIDWEEDFLIAELLYSKKYSE